MKKDLIYNNDLVATRALSCRNVVW